VALSVVDAFVAGGADGQGLAFEGGHAQDPGGPGGPSLGVEISEASKSTEQTAAEQWDGIHAAVPIG
jgi:hypothetical protein